MGKHSKKSATPTQETQIKEFLDMEMNRRLGDDILCGPFFIVRDNGEGDFTSLTDAQMDYYKNRFAQPERFAEHEPNPEPFMRFIAF